MSRSKKGEPLIIGKAIEGSQLTKDQKKAYALFHDWFYSKKGKKEQILRVGGMPGTGKAIPDDTMVPTVNGLIRADQITLSDQLFNADGKPVKILGIYPQEERKRVYQITFADGRTAKSSRDHLWSVFYGDETELQTLKLGKIYKKYKMTDECEYYIPMPGPVQYEEHYIPVDPWIIGVFLHAGKFKSEILAVQDVEPNVLREFCDLTGFRTNNIAQPGEINVKYKFHYKSINQFVSYDDFFCDIPELNGVKLSSLHIPEHYFYNSIKNRMRLLQGLMDAGGYVSAKSFHVSYTTKSQTLAEDVVSLCRSLGYYSYMTEGHRTNHVIYGDTYTVHILCNNSDKKDLFMVPSKAHKRAKKCGYKFTDTEADGFDRLKITKIEKLEDRVSMRCFYVDDPSHLFITENYVPTHNTTLLKYIVESEGFDTKDCVVVSYTGQAVNVLRQDGVMGKTIHSTFMRSKEEPVYKNGTILTRRGIPIMKTVWVPVKSIPSSVKLIIVDESSFLSDTLEKQLASYGAPILELGDPLQLPPVGGKQCFYQSNLNYFMEEIMRQHKDSEILRLIFALKNGDAINLSEYGRQVKFIHAKDSMEHTFFQYRPFYSGVDMIITATNKQRQVITDLYREYIVKTKSPYPVKGEPLICRRNDWSLSIGPYPLTNGTIGYAKRTVGRSMIDTRSNIYYVDFQPMFIDNDYYDNLMCDAEFLTKPFGTDKTNQAYYTPGQKLEYAHAITVHSSQGSQANKVLYMDTYFKGDPEYLMRLRYTAVSRAKNILYYVIPYSRYGKWSDLTIPRNF